MDPKKYKNTFVKYSLTFKSLSTKKEQHTYREKAKNSKLKNYHGSKTILLGLKV